MLKLGCAPEKLPAYSDVYPETSLSKERKYDHESIAEKSQPPSILYSKERLLKKRRLLKEDLPNALKAPVDWA